MDSFGWPRGSARNAFTNFGDSLSSPCTCYQIDQKLVSISLQAYELCEEKCDKNCSPSSSDPRAVRGRFVKSIHDYSEKYDVPKRLVINLDQTAAVFMTPSKRYTMALCRSMGRALMIIQFILQGRELETYCWEWWQSWLWWT